MSAKRKAATAEEEEDEAPPAFRPRNAPKRQRLEDDNKTDGKETKVVSCQETKRSGPLGLPSPVEGGAKPKAKSQIQLAPLAGLPCPLRRLIEYRHLLQLLGNQEWQPALVRVIGQHAQETIQTTFSAEKKEFIQELTGRLEGDLAIHGFNTSLIRSAFIARVKDVEQMMKDDFGDMKKVKSWFVGNYALQPNLVTRLVQRAKELPKAQRPLGIMPPLPRSQISFLWWRRIMPYLGVGEILNTVGRCNRAWLEHVWMNLPLWIRHIGTKDLAGTEGITRICDLYQTRAHAPPIMISSLDVALKDTRTFRELLGRTRTCRLTSTAFATMIPSRVGERQKIPNHQLRAVTIRHGFAPSWPQLARETTNWFWSSCTNLESIHLHLGRIDNKRPILNWPIKSKTHGIEKWSGRRIPRLVLSLRIPRGGWTGPDWANFLQRVNEFVTLLLDLAAYDAFHLVMLQSPTDTPLNSFVLLPNMPFTSLAMSKWAEKGLRVTQSIRPLAWRRALWPDPVAELAALDGKPPSSSSMDVA